MALSPIRRIIKIGLQNTLPLEEYRKVVTTNYLAFFSIGGSLVMSVVSIVLAHWAQATICFAGAFLYGGIFILNHNRYINTATFYFVSLSILVVTGLSVTSIVEGVPSGVEYLFLALLAVVIMLFDKAKKNITYWMIFLVMLFIQIFKYLYVGTAFNAEFYFSVLNLFFSAYLLFLFLSFFKRVLSKAVEETNKHEKTLYSLLDNVPIFMALVDKEGVYKIANKHYSEQFGLDKNEIIGKKRSKILPQNILDNHNPYFKKALDGQNVSFLEKNVMPRGESMYSRGTYVSIKNEKGETDSISIYVDDVSELIEAEESLRRANTTKDKLFSIIAHDIRSPLNLFQSILNVSNEEMISKEDFLGYQKELKKRLKSLSERLDELLDWARTQLGGINAYPSEVDVNMVVQDNVELFRTLIKKKNIQFETSLKCDEDGWMDENHLQVAVRNLLHNALKYTESDGVIRVETSLDDDSVLIEIADSGAGMSKEIVDSIMKKEIQKSTLGTSGEIGTGLGLSLSLGLLEKNECIVTLESEPGTGSTFRIWIPRSDINDPVE